jgi:hypothetical protein
MTKEEPMRKTISALAVCAALGVVAAVAQPADHAGHMSMRSAPDVRHALDFPPPMREMMLANMRSHLESVGAIVASLAVGDGAKAADIAKTRLGVESPGAAACNPTAPMEGMAAMMAHHMPPEMRALGMSMHEAASAFAVEAANYKKGADPQPALAALARVTEACAACHSAYRLQ